jgi:C4-dicarboxylate-specific signal transduction histidine kinase
VHTFDSCEKDVLLTTAWLGGVTDHHDSASSTDAIDPTRREQEALRRLRLALARATRISRLGELAASIVHEVNQPLAAIRLNGETGLRWLNTDKPNFAEVRTLIERMIQDADRAVDIVALMRAMAAGQTTQQTHLTLTEVIDDAMILIQHELCSNDVAIAFDQAPCTPGISGNRLQLQQLVVNLVINAIQALAENDRESRKIAIRTSALSDDLVCCIVEDSGPGIDPSHFSHLFGDVFTTKRTGMGMGLVLSRSIVEMHGGEIRADNNSSFGGARFTFTLPVVKNKNITSPPR